MPGRNLLGLCEAPHDTDKFANVAINSHLETEYEWSDAYVPDFPDPGFVYAITTTETGSFSGDDGVEYRQIKYHLTNTPGQGEFYLTKLCCCSSCRWGLTPQGGTSWQPYVDFFPPARAPQKLAWTRATVYANPGTPPSTTSGEVSATPLPVSVAIINDTRKCNSAGDTEGIGRGARIEFNISIAHRREVGGVLGDTPPNWNIGVTGGAVKEYLTLGLPYIITVPLNPCAPAGANSVTVSGNVTEEVVTHSVAEEGTFTRRYRGSFTMTVTFDLSAGQPSQPGAKGNGLQSGGLQTGGLTTGSLQTGSLTTGNLTTGNLSSGTLQTSSLSSSGISSSGLISGSL